MNAPLPSPGRFARYLTLRGLAPASFAELEGPGREAFFDEYMAWAQAESDQALSAATFQP